MGKFSRGFSPLRGFRGLALAASLVSVAAPVALSLNSTPAAAQAVDGGDIAAFYRSRGGAPLWFSPRSGAAAQQLVQLLATAQADNLNPRRYNVRPIQRAVQDAHRGGPGAIQRAEAMLSAAFVAYARDQRHDPRIGIVYVDPELKPTSPSARALLNDAAHASSLSEYVTQLEWMNPIYAQLRQAIASRLYRSEAERRLLIANLERARALPAGNQPLRRSSTRPRRGFTCTRTGMWWIRCASSPAAGSDRPDADDECVHPLRRAQSLLELAARHHGAEACADHSQGRTRILHEEGLRRRRPVRRPTPAYSTRCQSTGMRSLPAGCRSICASGQDRRIRWAR